MKIFHGVASVCLTKLSVLLGHTSQDNVDTGAYLETISRTVRFSTEELRLIEEFLKKNPFFDFSSLTRTALTHFIHNPQLVVRPVSEAKNKLSSKPQKEH